MVDDCQEDNSDAAKEENEVKIGLPFFFSILRRKPSHECKSLQTKPSPFKSFKWLLVEFFTNANQIYSVNIQYLQISVFSHFAVITRF